MSYLEVRRLIDEGHLEQAITLARKDIENEKNEESCLGLFDVIKECCVNEINSNNLDRAEKCINQMEVVAQGVRDTIRAQRTIEMLRNRMIPGSDDVMSATRLARNGNAEEAYLKVFGMKEKGMLDERLHEQYGQLIYYYLREGLRTMGSNAAEDALNEYMSLQNPRPSSLHSSIINMASHVCNEYPSIKLLPMIEKWGINNLTDEDMRQVELSDRTISPLYQRLIDRCFQLGCSIDEISDVFLKNENIKQEEIIDRFCRRNYSNLYEATKRGRYDMMEFAKRYTNQTAGRHINNLYHSKSLSLIIQSIDDDTIVLFPSIMENWGIKNFREEDWRKQKKGNKEMPSLAQRALQTYIDSMKATRGTPTEEYEEWLRDAIAHDPKNEQNMRQLARLLVSKNERDEAVTIYKKLLSTNNKSYLWQGLAMATPNRDLKISALCKAMTIETREEALTDTRLELAQIFLEDGKMENAQRELLSYYNVCTQHQLRLKPIYDTLVKKITPGLQPSASNNEFYMSNLSVADSFILGEIHEEPMKIIEILKRKNKTGNEYYVITMLSAQGTKAQTNGDKFKHLYEITNPYTLIGQNYNVKYAENDNHIKVVEISETTEEIDLSPMIRVGYIDGLDKSRGWYHVYGTDSAHFVAENPSVVVKIGDFIEFYPIIPKDSTFKTAAITKRLEYKEGVEKFGTIKAVVARIDYSKHQFNCVSEGGMTGLVGYDNGSAPQPGEMLRVAYITKKDKKKEQTCIKYISVEPSEEESEELRKTIVGPIHLLKNEKNFEYGFINFEDKGYYVSGYQMKDKGIVEGDLIKAHVVNNGDNWFSFEIEKVTE